MYNKVNRFSVYLLLFIMLVLQSTLLDYIKIFNAKPDLLLLLVIFFGLFFGGALGFETGLAAGLLKDILSVDIFGVNTIILALTGLMTGLLSPKFFKESKLTQYLLVFMLSTLSMFARYFIDLYISKITYINLSEYLSGQIIPASFYTSLVSAIIFPILIRRYGLKIQEEFL